MSDIIKIHDIALADVLEPDEAAYYRRICREFSQTYHVPLPEVERLPYDYVLRHYFEAQLQALVESASDEAVDALDERMRRALDPNYDANEEDSINEFINMIEEEIAGKRKVKKKLRLRKDSAPKSAKKQSLNIPPPVTAGRRTFDDLPPDQAGGDGSGLDALDDLEPIPEDDEGGTELP